jgi:hypothetical protein
MREERDEQSDLCEGKCQILAPGGQMTADHDAGTRHCRREYWQERW